MVTMLPPICNIVVQVVRNWVWGALVFHSGVSQGLVGSAYVDVCTPWWMAELCGLFGDHLHHHHGGRDVVVGSGEGVAVLLRPCVGPAHNPHFDYESSSPLFPKKND